MNAIYTISGRAKPSQASGASADGSRAFEEGAKCENKRGTI